MNYDIQVCAMNTGRCFAGSQSLHDTTEGVDFFVPEKQDGDVYEEVHVRMYKQSGAEGCNENPSQGYWSGYVVWQ